MSKLDFCLCENKGADQLRGNCEADQRLCFLLHVYFSLKLQASSLFLWLYRSVSVRLVENPDEVLSRVAAQMLCYVMSLRHRFYIRLGDAFAKQWTRQIILILI